MRLLGKYAFDRMRDAFQGIFEFQDLSKDGKDYYMLELWQVRFVIKPGSLEIFINKGKELGYVSFVKFVSEK